MSETIHRTIDGQPYTLVRGPLGYGVTNATNRINRIHRTYHVQTTVDGTPLRCNCPDCYYRGNWCKHLRAVEKLQREQRPELVTQLQESAIRCGLPPQLDEADVIPVVDDMDDEIDIDLLFGKGV